MEWASTEHASTVEMMEKAHPLSFLARRSFAPRPLSEATEIFDTDDEDDVFDVNSDSRSTVSTPDEVHTPASNGLGAFEFHFDENSIKGPVGPHLFRSTPEIPSDSEDERIYLNHPTAPKTSSVRPFSSLNRAVAELDESQVRDWKPAQVAEWMAEAGFESSVVEKFLTHDISGRILLELQFEDLKELDITSYGKRHRVMSSIQHLRNSSMLSLETPLTRSPSRTDRQTRALQRTPLPEESKVLAYSTETGLKSRSSSRRGRRHKHDHDMVTPAESVSIVAIEQLLPKPHTCSKGEECSRWQRQQRKIRQYEEEFAALGEPEATPSVVVPSVVASSDVLGPDQVPQFSLTPERLGSVEPRDPQENVRQFLNFQMRSPATDPSPPPASSASFVPILPPKRQAELANLPKLSIPATAPENPADSVYRSPVSAIGQGNQQQAQLLSKLRADPYHYGGVASPADIFRIDTPFSAMDVPVTAMPADPCQRDVSQSVPPEMRYGAASSSIVVDPVGPRPSSTSQRRHMRHPSFSPSVAPVRESTRSALPREYRPEPKVKPARVEDIHHAGWVRKRKTTKLLCHEWQDHFVALEGTKLAVHKDDRDHDPEFIDVDEYTLTCSSLASSSKLSAAFKKSILGSNLKQSLSDQAYAFSLIPEGEKARKLFPKQQSHHFSVKSREDRLEWMRDLLLAKALKRGNENGHENIIHGNNLI